MSESLAGRTLAGRYDLLELIGRGGMGAVYRALDRELDEVVALKVIRADLAGDPDIVERFRSEVKLARRVTHANVARTYELGNADGVMFCTMELIEGESLSSRLRQRHKLPLPEAIAIAGALCDGLAAAHAVDVIHRDVKPDNVLLANDGRVVMADFGVASIKVDKAGELSGTPAYMAPEQALGEPPTPAADVYAVGVLLAEMLTGRRAFTGETTKILADKQVTESVALEPDGELPAELLHVIALATARELGQRYATAAQLRRALAPWDKAPRAVTHPPRLPIEVSEVITIIILPPTGDAERLHLAQGVHEELIARLSRVPRTRVLPRTVVPADEPNAFEVSLRAGDMLYVRVGRAGGPALSELHLPLAIEHLDDAAEASTRAIAGTVAVATATRPRTTDHEATEMVLRARHMVLRDFRNATQAIAMLEQAAVTAPDNPKVNAILAVSLVRMAFMAGEAGQDVRDRAARLARRAVQAAPHLVEAHLAMGHVELNIGDAAIAAGHFRRAIACAPQSAEAHEQLGRMLLEAGYLAQALDRLEEAIAINPNARNARWEIARAFALEGRWLEHDAIVAEMVGTAIDRALPRARYAWWRRDREKLATLRDALDDAQRVFLPGLLDDFMSVFLDGKWEQSRERLRAQIPDLPPNRRRRSFIGQLVAEAAAFSHDAPFTLEMIAYSISEGLFDLHWLERCPLLDFVRGEPDFQPLRAQIKRRADGILDALYGDHHLGTSETAVASGLY